MNRKSILMTTGILGAVAMGAFIPSAEAQGAFKTLKPIDGVSLDVGTKRVVGYYVADKNGCQLTLMMGERAIEDEVPAFSAARLKQTVAANASARVETPEGETLEFACQPKAASMTVRVLKTVAYKRTDR